MKIENIAYTADGVDMIGTLAVDEGRPGKRPGILVCHEGGGLTDHARDIAKRLAGLGYVAFAMDYFGGGGGGPLADRTQAMPKIMAWRADAAGIRLRAAAALEVLKAQSQTDHDRLAAIGYCFGGTTSLELARAGADLKAVVGFHSGLGTARPQDAANIVGKVLVAIGADDPIIAPEERLAFEREMTAAGVDWRLHLYGGASHSFTNRNAAAFGRSGFDYHAASDQRSWRAMIDLFDEVFGPV
jgi:dienelactone hydrolase